MHKSYGPNFSTFLKLNRWVHYELSLHERDKCEDSSKFLSFHWERKTAHRFGMIWGWVNYRINPFRFLTAPGIPALYKKNQNVIYLILLREFTDLLHVTLIGHHDQRLHYINNNHCHHSAQQNLYAVLLYLSLHLCMRAYLVGKQWPYIVEQL